jgi:hypothetical protein
MVGLFHAPALPLTGRTGSQTRTLPALPPAP